MVTLLAVLKVPVIVPILPVPVASDLMVTALAPNVATPGVVTWKVASGFIVIVAEPPNDVVPPVTFTVPVLVTRKAPFTVALEPIFAPTGLLAVRLLKVVVDRTADCLRCNAI